MAARHRIRIKVLSFKDNFAHIHIEVNIPNTMTVLDAVQYLKGYSLWALFRELPALKTKWFWDGEFWSKHYGNKSVRPQGEKMVLNYITRQGIPNKVS